MTGGAFKNTGNLLARNREIEELEKSVASLQKEIGSLRTRIDDIATAEGLLGDDIEQNKAELQEQYILQNTAKLNVERATEQKNESESVYASLQNESRDIEAQLAEIADNKERIKEEIHRATLREAEINQNNEAIAVTLQECTGEEAAATELVSSIQLEEAAISQKMGFVQ
jgi:chromosome segregation protein